MDLHIPIRPRRPPALLLVVLRRAVVMSQPARLLALLAHGPNVARRRRALGLLACLTVLLAAVPLPRAPLAVVVAAGPDDDDLPVFDAHIHYNRDAWGLYGVDDALALLDQAGVRRAFVSSTPDDGTLLLYQRAPDRIVPSLRLYRTSADQVTWTRDGSILPYVAERLGEGIPYRGLGELHLLPGQADAEVPRGIAALAANQQLVLHTHADAVAVEELLAVRPDITVLWAHAGLTEPPATVERVLAAHPNVWVELALRTDVAPGGRLDPRWAALFARYPDRFMIGTDTWVPAQWTRLPQLMSAVRGWLRQLPPELRVAIASTNAERLLGSPPPPSSPATT